MDLDLTNIQGNIVPGFNKDHQAFVFVRFRDREGARRWLTELQPEIASVVEVQGFRVAFKSIQDRRPHGTEPDGGSLDHISATWVNLAISFGGLSVLSGVGNLTGFSQTFRVNRVPGVASSPSLGDVHALLIVAADQTADLGNELGRQLQRMAACGVDQVTLWRGDTLPGDQRGHEHFGFKDGISQPAIAGTTFGKGPPVAAGEFILGRPDQTGQPSGGGLPDWTRNGSFLAFVQLQQHVTAFWSAMRKQAEQIGVKPEVLAAALVGRKLDAEGTPVDQVPSRLSHIGRGYSGWLPPRDASRHRLIRRGVPYGVPLKDGQPDDGERGLLFVAYQADIARQFEHVWGQWLNGPDFPVPGAGRDALVGQGAGQRPASIPRPGQKGSSIAVRLPEFVTPRYGGYFFAPSISALASLAGVARVNPVRRGQGAY
jgi:Dyp-type peroxidase family